MNSEGHQYIYVAAINLANVLNQSANLSIYRGASLKLREATVKLAASEIFNERLTIISVGASTGLYQSTENCIEELCDSIVTYLNKHYFGYTFVVVHCSALECNHNFSAIKECLIERARLAQLSQLSVSFDNTPAHESLALNQPVCKFSDLLPASLADVVSGKQGINKQLKARFDFGRAQKQYFYQTEIEQANITPPKNLSDLMFTNDIATLASSPSKEFTSMAGKVAYIYLDGNKFSAIQTQVVNDVESQIQFDAAIQALRAQFLSNFISYASQNKDYLTTDNQFRFETLLWGGDEMLFVLPAWKGFDFIEFFLKESESWQYQGLPLTHALGMVFCSHKSSVHAMRALATNLADRIKLMSHQALSEHQESPDKTLQPYLYNKYDFMILESIDYPNESLTQHFTKQYQGLGEAKEKNFYTHNANDKLQRSELAQSLTLIAKSQIYKLAKKAMQIAKSFQLVKENNVANITAEVITKHHEEILNVETRVGSVSELLKLSDLKSFLYRFFFNATFAHDSHIETKELLLEQQLKRNLLVWVLLAESWDYIICGLDKAQGAAQ